MPLSSLFLPPSKSKDSNFFNKNLLLHICCSFSESLSNTHYPHLFLSSPPPDLPPSTKKRRKKMASYYSSLFFVFIFFFLFHAPFHLCHRPLSTSVIGDLCLRNRRVLHEPLFPLPATDPPSPPPSSLATTFPKYPSSTNPTPFFPLYFSPPSPPSTTPSSTTVPSSSTPTLPANITSLIFPAPRNSPNHSSSTKKLVAAILLPILALAFLGGLFLFVLLRRRKRKDGARSPGKSVLSDSRWLFPPNITTSDGRKLSGSATTTTVTTSDLLYLGNVANSRGTTAADESSGDIPIGHGSPYRKLGSPELHPLPPLTKQSRHVFVNAEGGFSSDDEFYSPRGSSVDKDRSTLGGSARVFIAPVVVPEKFAMRNSNSSSPYQSSNSASSPTPPSSPSPRSSPPVSYSPGSSKSPNSRSEDLAAINGHMDVEFCHPPPPPPPIFPLTPSPPKRKLSSLPPLLTPPPAKDSHKQPDSNVPIGGINRKPTPPFSQPPPPPPPPPTGYWESKIQREVKQPEFFSPRPPAHPKNTVVTVHMPVETPRTSDDLDSNNEETNRPKLKPLHWDKVRASSDRVMVWDQLRSSSFQLNEEMIETLFVCNPANPTPKESSRKQVLPSPNQENRVLDPKKSQNIAIILRALNVTKEEVCEALLEGNTDCLGTELLETLLKMAPTKEEEIKLKEYKDESSPFRLGTAEKFLRAVIGVPFAFKRVEAMLYTTNFESEVNYLRKSFETLEAACEELRNSRMFLKLLEAVLKTGNRMNVGTNRGDARAFKLDTLLKLVDVKGTDGKTTLLHFVVQEIVRLEGSRLSAEAVTANEHHTQSTFSFKEDDLEFKKLGLPVVSGISGELSNVKKAAAMDSDVLSTYVSKLAAGIGRVGEVITLNESVSTEESGRKFHETMSKFLKKAEDEILRIQAQESVALSLVKEITEYFHGNSAREEAHPFRIFMVVRDFLSTLDQVCKEVGSIISSSRQFPVPINPTIQLPVFFSHRDDNHS